MEVKMVDVEKVRQANNRMRQLEDDYTLQGDFAAAVYRECLGMLDLLEDDDADDT